MFLKIGIELKTMKVPFKQMPVLFLITGPMQIFAKQGCEKHIDFHHFQAEGLRG